MSRHKRVMSLPSVPACLRQSRKPDSTSRLRESLDAEQRLHESRQKLYSQGALARKDLDQSAVSLTQARNQVDLAERHFKALERVGRHQEVKSAQGQLTSAQGKYEGAEAQLAYSQIRSPIDGMVADRPLYPGEMATAGSPLFTVMDASQVVARAHVAQPDAAFLKPGDAAALIVPGQQGGDLPGACDCGEPGARSKQHHRRSLSSGSEPRGSLEGGINGEGVGRGPEDLEYDCDSRFGRPYRGEQSHHRDGRWS